MKRPGEGVKVRPSLTSPEPMHAEFHDMALDSQYTENLEKWYSHKDQGKLVKPRAPEPAFESSL